MKEKHARSAGVMRKVEGSDKRRCISLLDLPETLITSILRCLPTRNKCQAERVCKTFREMLSDPTPGSFVWDVLSLSDPVFHQMSLHKLNRWLLRHIEGVLVLGHHGEEGEEGPHRMLPAEANRDQQIVLTTLPLLSGLLHPEATLHLDLSWVMTDTLFAQYQPDLATQLWSSLSTVVTRLHLMVEERRLTEAFSAVLCQLTRLQQLDLGGEERDGHDEPLVLTLDLPVLEHLKVSFLDLESIRLTCPKLEELTLESVELKSFCGLPTRIQNLELSLVDDSIQLRELLEAHNAENLQELVISEDDTFTDPETVKSLCLNGKLRYLVILYNAAAAGGAFSVDASWQSVPQTLQDIHLRLPLDRGIPRILEQLPRLISLYLRHNGNSLMHLDRPLDPFLDMPRLKDLELWSSCNWDTGEVTGGRITLWTPPALRLLGLAEKRLRQMQRTSPGRTITLIY